jgi:hypothetical protein
MQGSEFDETEFFRAIGASGARALLIGRQALIALGLPVLTSDYDFWVHTDDIEAFNAAVVRFDLFPNHEPAVARRRGRYVLENDEHVDVLLMRARTTTDGREVSFDDVWARRQSLPIQAAVVVAIPSLDDLILTKRFGARPRDAEDIRLLESLRARRGTP